MSTGAVVIQRLKWGWRVYFQDGSFTGLEASVPHHMALSIGCLSVLATWWLASPSASDCGERESLFY